MNNIFKFSLILLFLVFHSLKGQDILNQYLIMAAENNPGLKASYFEYQAALEKVAQTGSLPDPQIGFGYFIQPVETRLGPQRARLSLMQMFPWFGTLDTQQKAAAMKAKVMFKKFEQEKSKLFYEIRAGFFRLYFIQKTTDVTRENLEILESIQNLVTAEIIAGRASVADEIQLEIELADLQNELIKYQELYQAELEKFKNLLNVEPEYIPEIPDSLPAKDIILSDQEIRDKIQSNNPELHQVDYLQQYYIQEEKLASKNGMPKFSLGVDYIFIGEREQDGMSLKDNGRDAIIFPTVSFSLPIYRAKYSGKSKEARFMQQASGSEKEDVVNKLETLLEEAKWTYQDADRRFKLYRNQQKLARRALAILEADYLKKNKSLEDLLRMEKKVINYGIAWQKALADKQTTIAFISYLMGE